MIRLEARRDFERRMGCPERYITGAIGNEPLEARDNIEGPSLMATRAEMEDVRERLAKAGVS